MAHQYGWQVKLPLGPLTRFIYLPLRNSLCSLSDCRSNVHSGGPLVYEHSLRTHAGFPRMLDQVHTWGRIFCGFLSLNAMVHARFLFNQRAFLVEMRKLNGFSG